MTSAQRLADAVKAKPELARLNPLDVQRFAISWLLDELDRIELRVAKAEGKIAMMQGDDK